MQPNDMDEHFEMQRLVDQEESKEEDAEVTSRSTQIRKCKRCPYLGIILAAMSAIFFSLVSVIVKYLVNVHPTQLVLCRFVGVILATVPIVIWQNEHPFPKGKSLTLFLRSFFATASLMSSFYAFRHMPLADASVLVFSFPVFVAIIALIFLKEPCGLFNVITISLTLFGVILISSPTFIFGSNMSAVDSNKQLVQFDLWGPVAAFLSALFGANDIVLMRALKDINFSVIMVNFGTVALILSLTTTWGLDVICWPQCGSERILTVALALFSFGGQVLLTLALKIEQAGPVSIARSSDIMFAFIWQIVFFQEVPNWYIITGAFLVITSVFLSGIKTWVMTLPEISKFRKMCSIFEM